MRIDSYVLNLDGLNGAGPEEHPQLAPPETGVLKFPPYESPTTPPLKLPTCGSENTGALPLPKLLEPSTKGNSDPTEGCEKLGAEIEGVGAREPDCACAWSAKIAMLIRAVSERNVVKSRILSPCRFSSKTNSGCGQTKRAAAIRNLHLSGLNRSSKQRFLVAS